MAWIQNHVELKDHVKFKRLVRALNLLDNNLGACAAEGALSLLWKHAFIVVPDGILRKYQNEDIADACGWNGNADAFVNALENCGFLERNKAKELVIHDWDENMNPRFNRLENQAKSMQELRARRKNETCDTGVTPKSRREKKRIEESKGDENLVEESRGEETARQTATTATKRPLPKTASLNTGAIPSTDTNALLAEVMDAWNTTLTQFDFPPVLKTSPKRETLFAKAVAVDPPRRKNMEFWKHLINKVLNADFLQNAAAERAPWLCFDWILKEDNLVKVLEGRYDDASKIIYDGVTFETIIDEDPFDLGEINTEFGR